MSSLWNSVRASGLTLYAPSAGFIKRCANVTVRVIVISLAWAFLAGLGIGLDMLLKLMLALSSAPESFRTILSYITLGLPIFLGAAIALIGAADILRLMRGILESETHDPVEKE